ncbi:hypothetical protein GPY51_19620 [Photorhabdus laumondii subsp. laumondii]|uniref:Photorhabdus luminescens subsp. laumondii TTO1 complete genome segment 3/17 n=2 Tax=Photorhabdus laumondii subsp. laumondii TaxID=141679 RepID=Q7N8H0_PHOLL|nr:MULTISPECIES: transglutaminase domain-containing protein [Photorhabdus]AWK40697.1 hypothetical protein A4R40_03765 [Photorhabdus laumondii subsp. laumondii]AXG41510.1 hypothetical protein PluDJC_03840 [Photorhabdus laumondii subsp. laumondii]AXG46033.1 hypothetical protein PluTT01m_03870 [Photorhabdus laumondii subsp. laumondii]MCC8384191.1 transglutaminase domain-containing protein [Photorhabdus laumondii]MCC8388460.1 transglutaminase domain-containing protein [Photorhabdus laumondii]
MLDPINHYRQHTEVTLAASYSSQLDDLPNDVEGLISIVQNLLIHYQTEKDKLNPDIISMRNTEIDSRCVSLMLKKLLLLDDSSFSNPRPPEKRLLSTCRDFSVLLCSFMRHKNIPARVRYGFAHYQYNDECPMHDHTLVEYWNGTRWLYAESRLNFLSKPLLGANPSDFPRHLFFSGAEIWRHIRQGTMNERIFSGYRFDDGYGQWIVRNLFFLDLASLAGYEPLIWDSWGILLEENPGARVTDVQQLNFLDRMALLDPCLPDECNELITSFNNYNELSYQGKVHSFSPVSGAYCVDLHARWSK